MAIADRLQVFISSVMAAENLQPERAAVADAISSLHLAVPWRFEYAPAEPSPSPLVYLREVAASDLLVLIVSNSHSPAVQAELNQAVARGRPILAFVRSLSEAEPPSDERLQALRWLRDRVKYQYYHRVDDLSRSVRDAIAAELVRGYRKYHVGRSDLQLLFDSVGSPPSLVVQRAFPRDFAEARQVLLELRDWYPEIEGWIHKITSEVDDAGTQLRIARMEGEIAGLAVARDKDNGVRKFSTLYVRPGFRGEAVGPRLIYEEVRRAAHDGVRKAYVTFAGELFDSLEPLLTRYGFVAEGVSAGRYRPGAAEWVMAKTFVYGAVKPDAFQELITTHLISEVGGRIISEDGGEMRVSVPRSGLFGLRLPTEFELIVSTSPEPETAYRDLEATRGQEPWVFVSLYGKPAAIDHWGHGKANWIDGEDIAARLYPVQLVRPNEDSIIVTIQPGYADALIPDSTRPPLFGHEKLQIRPDNSYYRTPDRYRTLRRGSRIFFYVSSPERTLRGSARVRELQVGPPEELVARYGSLGILKFDQISAIADKHGGAALAIGFDWYQEHEQRQKLSDLRATLALNPIAARLLNSDDARRLLQAAKVV